MVSGLVWPLGFWFLLCAGCWLSAFLCTSSLALSLVCACAVGTECSGSSIQGLTSQLSLKIYEAHPGRAEQRISPKVPRTRGPEVHLSPPQPQRDVIPEGLTLSEIRLHGGAERQTSLPVQSSSELACQRFAPNFEENITPLAASSHSYKSNLCKHIPTHLQQTAAARCTRA